MSSNKLRKQIIKSSYEAGACHLGSALSCADLIEAIYYIKKQSETFLFAKASGVAALYCYLHPKKAAKYLKEYPLPDKRVPGIEHSFGSLGHGIPVAVGVALANKKKRVYCLIGDADLQEGTFWESLLFASHHNLSNLVILVDRNNIQACGKTEKIIKLNPLRNKIESFGCDVHIVNGHNRKEIEEIFDEPIYMSDEDFEPCGLVSKQFYKPTVVIAKTTKGKGVDFMENNHTWHYKNLDEHGLKNALSQLS